MSEREAGPERILVAAPTGRDAALTADVLGRAGYECRLCRDAAELCREAERDAAALLIAEEVLTPAATRAIAALLGRQEPWSDLPILMFTGFGATIRQRTPSVELISPLGNVTLLERPIHVVTLLSAVAAAVRARRRQYATRQVLTDLAEGVRQRDHFLAVLGHELRNPLSAILLATEAMAADPSSPKYRERIGRQARQLAHLVDDLLDVSRVTAGKISLRLQPVDLAEVARNAIEAVQPLAAADGVRVDLERAHPATLLADPTRLEQIAGNLLTNAVKYTPSGGRVSVRVEREGASAVLSVRDTGVGMSRDLLSRIFEPFVQASSTLDRARGGMGLGLALVRGLAQLHGGSVTAASAGAGLGSCFTVRLPLAKEGEVIASDPTRPPPDASARRVLVVEDNGDHRELLRTLLGANGHEVDVAADGQAGIAHALAFRPEVMLVDIGLPGVDGYEVARQVRAALGRRVGLVAVTGYGSADVRRRALDAGFDEHLTKPVDVDTLQRTIGAVAARAAT